MEKNKTHLEELMQVLNFNVEDLESNQEGELTEFQKRKLKAKFSSYRHILAFEAVIILFGLYLFLGAVQAALNNSISPTGICFIILFTISVLITLHKNFGFIYNVNKDIKNSKVEMISGRIKCVSRYEQSMKLYFIYIDNFRLQLNYKQIIIFRNLEYYSLYYAPYSKIIVAAEPLDNGNLQS